MEQQSIIVVHPVPVLVPNRPEKPTRNQSVLLTEIRPISAITSRVEPEEKSSARKKNLPKPEEKSSTGGKNKKGRKFNGGGGRIHTEAQIDQILDWYLETGELPDYVSERQRHSYRHHIRLPERRELLDKQQTITSNKASGDHSATGHKDNITRLPRTGTHHP